MNCQWKILFRLIKTIINFTPHSKSSRHLLLLSFFLSSTRGKASGPWIVGYIRFGISVHEEEDSAPVSRRIMRHSSGGRKRAETEAGYLQDECQPQPWQSFPSIYIIAVVWTLFWLLTRAREGEGDMQIRISIIAGIALNGLLERGRQPFRVIRPIVSPLYRSWGMPRGGMLLCYSRTERWKDSERG